MVDSRRTSHGRLLHHDDTPMRILKRVIPVEKKGRIAVRTTAILSHLGEHRIALFLTSPKHAEVRQPCRKDTNNQMLFVLERFLIPEAYDEPAV
jgi:hypothetical protein